MTKQIALVLLLSTFISSLAEKQQSLLKKSDRELEKPFVAQFTEENIPRKQFGSIIYDSNTNVVRIQEIKDFLILVLNSIGFDHATAVQKLNTSEVSLLIEAMDVCDSIAKVDLTEIGKLKNILEIVTNSEIVIQNMDKAVDIIKGKFKPKSKLSDKQLHENSPKGNKQKSDEKSKIQANRQIFYGNKDAKDEENKKSLRKTNRTRNDEGLNGADAFPFSNEKLLKKKLEDNTGDIKNEINNDELENPSFNKRKNISEYIIKKPIFRKESIKDSYQFISEEQLNKLESKSEEKNTSSSKTSNSESEELKIIKMLQSKIEKLEQEQDTTNKNVENLSGKLNDKLTSIESQSKSLAENLEKQSAQSKDLAEKLKNQSSELKDEISKNVTKYRVLHKTLTGNNTKWSYKQSPTDFGIIGDFDMNFEISSEKGAVVLCNVAGHLYHDDSKGHAMIIFVLDKNTKGYQGSNQANDKHKFGAFYSYSYSPWIAVSFSHFQTFLVSKGSHNISLYSNNSANNSFYVNGSAMQLTIIEN